MLFSIAIIFCVLAVFVNPSVLSFGAALLLISLAWFGRRERQAVNPYYLFLPTPFSLLLYSSDVSRLFLPEIHLTTQIIIIAAVFAYFFGLIVVRNANVRGNPASMPSYSFWAVLLLGLIPHALGIARAGIPMLAADIEASRSLYVLPIIGQFTVFLPLAMLIAFQKRSKRKIILSSGLSLALTIITLSKFSIMLVGTFFFFGYVKYRARDLFRIKPQYIFFVCAALIPFMFEAIFSFREALSQDEYYWRGQVSFEWDVLREYGDYTYLPYLYFTTPWSNFAYLIEGEFGHSYGARTIFPFASILQVDDLLFLGDKPIRMFPFNTHAFVSDFYLDFGVFGAVLFSFILGILVKWIYTLAERQPDVVNEGIWVAFGFASLLLFFSNHFTGLTYPLVSLVLFNFYRFSSQIYRQGGS